MLELKVLRLANILRICNLWVDFGAYIFDLTTHNKYLLLKTKLISYTHLNTCSLVASMPGCAFIQRIS
jgi:hypothetical protein